MPHYGLLGNYITDDPAHDIRGSALYGSDDERLGKIDDVIFNHATGDIAYVVVDTGGWLSTRKFIVPAHRLRSSRQHRDDVDSDLTKRQIESFPPYEDSHLESQKKWDEYESRYRAKWEADPVMHRRETDRNITPTTQQLQGNRSSLAAEERASGTASMGDRAARAPVRAASAPTERVVPAGRDSVVISNTAAGIGPRWDTFQARLRQRRKEAVGDCRFCGGSESAEDLKKAI